jgi:polyphenol oxidase
MKFLEFNPWQGRNELIHGLGTRGNSGEKITRSDWKGRSIEHGGARFPLISLRQIHGEEIVIFKGGRQEAADLWEKEGDALITGVPGFAIAVFTADCLPILLFDPRQRIIAAVHAGWRGTARGVVQSAVARMAKEFACRREEVQAGLGPAVGPCCYEVDEPVEAAFRQKGLAWELFAFLRKPGKWALDLKKANSHLLAEAGVQQKNIFSLDSCTACQANLFFSYRREKGTPGRHLNFIALR